MDVRQVRPTDAPLVLSLAVDRGAHLVNGPAWPETTPVTQTVMRALFPLALPGRAWVAQDGPNLALLEAQPRQYVIGWDVTRLAIRGEVCDVLSAAVQAAVSHLQNRGVPRLFARCGSGGCETLKRFEFHALAREYVLIGPKGDVSEDTTLPIDSRYRMPPDAWPLHQLEHQITPSLVRQFEGLTSLEWTQSKRNVSEIVVERDGRIVAWIGWSTKARRGLASMGMLLHPDHKELGGDLLHHALRNLPAGSQPMARVREYHVEALKVFTDAGFRVAAEEMLLVKHAGVELARVAKGRVRVASVPGIRAFPFRLGALGPDISRTPQPSHEDSRT